MTNVSTIMGRLTADPILRETKAGIHVTSAIIACQRDYVKAGEERITDFLPVTIWNNKADFFCNNCKKGDLVVITGTLISKNIEKNGEKRCVLEIIADKISIARKGGEHEHTNEAVCPEDDNDVEGRDNEEAEDSSGEKSTED